MSIGKHYEADRQINLSKGTSEINLNSTDWIEPPVYHNNINVTVCYMHLPERLLFVFQSDLNSQKKWLIRGEF